MFSKNQLEGGERTRRTKEGTEREEQTGKKIGYKRRKREREKEKDPRSGSSTFRQSGARMSGGGENLVVRRASPFFFNWKKKWALLIDWI